MVALESERRPSKFLPAALAPAFEAIAKRTGGVVTSSSQAEAAVTSVPGAPLQSNVVPLLPGHVATGQLAVHAQQQEQAVV